MLAGPESVTLAVGPLDAARAFLSNLNSGGPLLVAVSGGGDSLALLLALHEAATASGDRRALFAATVDHGLRAASAEEARWVAAFCARHDIPHKTLVWSGDKPATGLQAGARLARYRLLAEEVLRLGAVGLVTAHTLDDQAETVAMRAARGGEGFSPGLAGMAQATLFARSAWILRPFLAIRRSALRGWLVERGEDWLDDPSNEDRRFERVRMRANLAGAFDAEAVRGAQDRRRRIFDRAAAVVAERVRVHGGCLAQITTAPDVEDPAVRTAIETVVALIGGTAARPSRDQGNRLMEFISSGRLSRLTVGRAVVDRRSDGLYIYRERRSLSEIRLRPGETTIWDGRYRIENRSGADVTIRPAGSEEASRAGNLDPFRGVRPDVVRRAAAAQPLVTDEKGRAMAFLGYRELPVDIRATRHFALFDVFLPDFDLKLANQCMETFGGLGYGLSPVGAR